jgi:hypothetical protein
MIYIWDNGGAYSSHSVEFIEVADDIDREQAEIVMTHQRWDQPEIVATVNIVNWRSAYGPSNFWEWFTEGQLTENHDNRSDPGPVSVTWDWSKDRKWATTLSPLAGKLKLSFIRRAMNEWDRIDAQRCKDAHDPKEALANCKSVMDRLRRLVDLGVEHGVWQESK